jgi:dihydroflavonol-4-reductase
VQILITNTRGPLTAQIAQILRQEGARVLTADTADAAARALEGCDALLHRVEDDARLPGAALEGRALLAAAAAAKVRRLLLSLPASVLGPGDGARPVEEGDDALPGDPGWGDGARWHLEAEWLAANDARAQSATLLTGALFGPMEGGLGCLEALAAPTRWPLPRVSLNVSDLRDVARAHAAALTRARPGQRYLLGGAEVGADELAAITREALGRAPQVAAYPPGPLLELARRRWGLDDGIAPRLSHQKARAELGYAPRHHRVTLLDALAWHRQRQPSF